jgi:hypothetical protein
MNLPLVPELKTDTLLRAIYTHHVWQNCNKFLLSVSGND